MHGMGLMVRSASSRVSNHETCGHPSRRGEVAAPQDEVFDAESRGLACSDDEFKRNVAIIGAGPAGLMAAEVLAQGGASVTVYDAMPSAGRKFLMAGRGGLNLTHSEPLPQFLARYGEATPHLAAAIEAFPPEALRAWSEALGQPTFVGSSGRVFPKAFKASPLLRAWLRRLDAHGRAIRAAPPLDRLGRRRPSVVSKRRTDRAPSMRAPPCWRSAAQAGRGSAPTAHGWKRSRRRA